MHNVLPWAPCCGRTDMTDDMLAVTTHFPAAWGVTSPLICGHCIAALHHRGVLWRQLAEAIDPGNADAYSKACLKDHDEARRGVTLPDGRMIREVLLAYLQQ